MHTSSQQTDHAVSQAVQADSARERDTTVVLAAAAQGSTIPAAVQQAFSTLEQPAQAMQQTVQTHHAHERDITVALASAARRTMQASGYNEIEGTDAGETLNGTNGDDLIYGYAGNDNLYGNLGSDIL